MTYYESIRQWLTASPTERENIFEALKTVNTKSHPYLPSGMVIGYSNKVRLLFQLLDDVRIDTLTERSIFYYLPGSFVAVGGSAKIITVPTLRVSRCYIIGIEELNYYNKQKTV